MVKIPFDKIAIMTRLGFLIAFILLIFSYFLTFISTQKVIDQANRVNQTNKIIHGLDITLSYIVHGESSYRGYILTKDSLLLQKHNKYSKLADSSLNALEFKVIENNEQKENLAYLRTLVEEKISWMKKLQSDFSFQESWTPFLKNEIRTGMAMTEKIESQVFKMQNIESEIWKKRGKEVSEYTGLIKIFNTVSIILAILFTLFSLLVYNKENRAKKKESEKALNFRKQLENRIDELADLNKELINLRSLEKYAVTGRIARTIAHEVRNPLTNINLSIEQLRSEIQETETSEMFFKMIQRNSERINNLVSDLLNSTRVTELTFVSANINHVLDESLEMASDRIELKQIKVEKEYDPEICNFSADIQKIKVAFLNIIVNAVEAMDNNGTLILKTFAEKDKCVVQINDTGIGMTTEQLDKIFEPYFTTKDKGNGLGLANTQNIILSHNGNISVESTPGEGTTFTVILDF
ncbi:MAG: ATP-binding protein [Ginsengibacter sp.]